MESNNILNYFKELSNLELNPTQIVIILKSLEIYSLILNNVYFKDINNDIKSNRYVEIYHLYHYILSVYNGEYSTDFRYNYDNLKNLIS